MNEFGMRFKSGCLDSIPIVAGFIPACFTFGLVGKGMNLGNLEVFLLSALVYAGASQFIGVKLLAAGTAAPVILLLTFIINLRYLFISLSFGGRLKRSASVLSKAWIGFSLTEEVYAVSMISQEKQSDDESGIEKNTSLSVPYLLGLQIPPYVANLFATAAGISFAVYVPVEYLPALNTSLYVLLIALIVPQLRGNKRNLGICISAALSSWLLHPLLGNAAVLIAMLIGMSAGNLLEGKNVRAKG